LQKNSQENLKNLKKDLHMKIGQKAHKYYCPEPTNKVQKAQGVLALIKSSN